jgi:3-hydroxyacyl-CoA dehydrogenase
MIKTIAVIGGGTMGHGIAECFALHAFRFACAM